MAFMQILMLANNNQQNHKLKGIKRVDELCYKLFVFGIWKNVENMKDKTCMVSFSLRIH